MDNPNQDFHIFKQEGGVISPVGVDVWVCLSEGYMYIADTLEQLIEVLNTEWKMDRHLAQ